MREEATNDLEKARPKSRLIFGQRLRQKSRADGGCLCAQDAHMDAVRQDADYWRPMLRRQGRDAARNRHDMENEIKTNHTDNEFRAKEPRIEEARGGALYFARTLFYLSWQKQHMPNATPID